MAMDISHRTWSCARIIIDSNYGKTWGGWCSNAMSGYPMGWGSGSTSGVDGLNFLVLPILRQVMGPESNSEMAYGVAIGHLRKLIKNSMV